MVGEIQTIGQKHRERAFVVERVARPDYAELVVQGAELLRVEVFRAGLTPAEVTTAVEKQIDLVSEHKAQNVNELNTQADSGGPDSDEAFSRNLYVDGLFLYLRDGESGARRGLMTTGSIKDIENILPDPLKGLAREVRNRHVITNSDIASVFDQIDALGWDDVPPSQLSRNKALNAADEQLRAMGGVISADDRPQWVMALRYVNGLMGEEAPAIVQVADNGGVDLLKALQNKLDVPHHDDSDVELAIQTAFARAYLHSIEQSDRTIADQVYGEDLARIEKVIDQFQPKVQREIRARLAVDFSSRAMRYSDGFISSKNGVDMGAMSKTAEKQRKDPNRDVMRFLFNQEEDTNGLPFRGGWDWIQYANFRYLDLLDLMSEPQNVARLQELAAIQLNISDSQARALVNPKTLKKDLKAMFDNDAQLTMADVNFHSDKDDVRKGFVRMFVIDQLMYGDKPPDDDCHWNLDGGEKIQDEWSFDEAGQAFDMAKNACEAFGETNVANAALQQGNDQLAELVGFKKYREGKVPRTGAGPAIHINLITTIPGATSWVRQLDSDPMPTLRPLYAQDVAWSKVAPGDYSFYYGVTLSKIQRFAMEYLLATEVKTGDVLNPRVWRDIADLANRAEKPINVVDIGPNRERLIVERDRRGSFVTYEGRDYRVVEERKRVVGYPGAVVDGPYVKHARLRDPVRVQTETVIETDPITNVDEKVTKEFMVIGPRRYEITREQPPYVNLPGIGRRKVEKGNQGRQLLRTRFLQTLAEIWSTDESLGANYPTFLELGRLVSEEELWPGRGTFVTQRQYNMAVLDNRKFDLINRMAALDTARSKLTTNTKKNPGAARF